ncbi:MAG: energy-coupling factor ABC transporter ATP-binding protein [Propioniciclava sp.]
MTEVTLTLTEPRIAVVGANGSGKSTLLRVINGLTLVSAGTIRVDGLDPQSNGAQVRRRVGFVFTDPMSQLIMPTAVEDVELSLRRTLTDRNGRRERARQILAERGLAAQADQSIHDLSGGERQLVALASVLAVNPSIVVMDEPTTLLDLRNRNRFRRVLAELPQQVVFATHDLDLAREADRVVVIDDGRVVADGAPAKTVDLYIRSLG